jgi:CheY-like chemotaxis protein
MAKSDLKPILLVEDNGDDVLFFKRALKKAGLSNPLYIVSNLAAARQYLNGDGAFVDRTAHPFPSILVVDIKLPDGDGRDLLRWVRTETRFKGLHCIVVTGHINVSIFQQCYSAGADSFLRKPCDFQELQNVATGFAQHWL